MAWITIDHVDATNGKVYTSRYSTQELLPIVSVSISNNTTVEYVEIEGTQVKAVTESAESNYTILFRGLTKASADTIATTYTASATAAWFTRHGGRGGLMERMPNATMSANDASGYSVEISATLAVNRSA